MAQEDLAEADLILDPVVVENVLGFSGFLLGLSVCFLPVVRVASQVVWAFEVTV